VYQPRRAIPRSAVLILLLAFVVVGQSAQPSIRIPFTRTDAMITMRDGVRLHTVILTPQTQTEPLPILIDRTPYGVNEWNSDLVNAAYKASQPAEVRPQHFSRPGERFSARVSAHLSFSEIPLACECFRCEVIFAWLNS